MKGKRDERWEGRKIDPGETVTLRLLFPVPKDVTGKTIKIELLLLDLFFSKPATDIQAKQLAIGAIENFSGWRVEARNADQLLMCDLIGNTRSWLMVAPQPEGSAPVTRLYFRSAVLASRTKANGEPRMSAMFRSLLWFHKLYSRVLLDDARARLLQVSR